MDKPETIHAYLKRRLAEHVGHHSRIAEEAGVAQSTVSRMHLGKAEPSLAAAQKLIDWFDAYDRARRVIPRSAFFPGDAGVAARRRRVHRDPASAPLGR